MSDEEIAALRAALAAAQAAQLRAEQLRAEERVGRCRAERTVRELLAAGRLPSTANAPALADPAVSASAPSSSSPSSPAPSSSSTAAPSSSSTVVPSSSLTAAPSSPAPSSSSTAAPSSGSTLASTAVWPMRVLGRIRTVFPTRNGTPRQGLLVDEARATLVLDPSLHLNAVDAFDGLDGYSHVWLVFVFHENTNAAAWDPAHTPSVKAKITPPRLGTRIGLFATRTPHRPSPIGLSLVRLDHVDPTDGTLHLRGVDLVDGTPILDIKPYLPSFESVPGARVPGWLEEAAEPDFTTVAWADEARAELTALAASGALRHFGADESEEVVRLADKVLAWDLRALHRQHKPPSQGPAEHSVRLDTLTLQFRLDRAQHSVHVTSVALA